ncbi:MAG: SpaA isopeptide-forming pilin-related protein [Candidatus Ventricola sp.]
MERRTKRRRGTALFLALVMLVSLLPLNVLAESDDIIAQVEAESTEEEQEAEADTMESPEEGDFLMPEVASEDIPAETSPQEEGTQEPPQSEEAPEGLLEELPTTEAEPEEITDEPEAVEPPPDDESAEEQPEEQPGPLSVRDALWQSDHAYVLMQGPAPLWCSADMTQGVLYEIAACNSVLLATEVVEQDAGDMVRAWLMTEEYEVLCGYVSIEVLNAYALTDEEAEALAGQLWAWPVETEAGTRTVFVIEGEKAQEDMPEQEETPEWDDPDEVIVSDQWDGFLSDYTDDSTEAVLVAQPGDYIAVTTDTRAYLCVDETIDDEYGYDGDDYAGHFVNDAVLRVVSLAQDGWGRDWYEAEYEFGEALDNGKYLWTDVGTIFVLASETQPTDAQALTITDHAYRETPPQIALFSMSTTGMDGFSLRSCSQSTPYVYAGQTDVYATSGHDSEYPQIASLPGHGTIYATPHYINNCVVYCLEHTMPGPNANDGDGGRHPTGPYTIVDLDTYERTLGASGYIFKTETMHALAWVLRHTVPFMELARSDANNTVWSRVAGQFAMREVIKEMEGEFYVREYWIMEDFVRQAGQAPAVYLEYARWLAENGIAYGRMSGNITASGKSMQPSGSGYVATVTLTTDADRMRISRDVGELTGNSGGSDWQYYYLYSGDTISVASASASLSFTVESHPSSDDEANFLVGIPSVEIQKVLIPQDGDPVPMKAVRLSFEVPMGAVSVTKRGDSGTLLSGAVFELVSSAGAVLATQTTGSDGVTTFTNVQPGTYTVREKSAPEGYLLSANAAQSVNVAAGNTAAVTFSNDIIRGKIRIQKTDELTGKALAGATFMITRLSAPPAHNGAGVGQVAATITTDASGVAETSLLDWGRYQVRETGVPQFYKDKSFSAEVSVTQSGQTVTLDVTNEPIAGWIQLTKTDRLDGTPIAGVQFDIYENDEYGNALAGTMTTDASGVATSPALRKGSYLVCEHGTPTGYCADSIELSAEVRPTETTSITATNQPIQGRIRIVKADELTGETLASAEFTVTRVSGLPSHNGTGNAEIVAVITTNAEGIAETPLLTWGEYQVKETGVPEHFVDNRFTANVVIDKENLETYTVDVTNEPTKGFIQLNKTDRQNSNPIEGVTFDIFYNDQYGEGLAATMVTGSDGVATSPALRKGRYIVRERGETAGYVFEEVTLPATVHSDETTPLEATNRHVTVRLKLYKRDVDEYDGDDPNMSEAMPVLLQLPEPAYIAEPVTRGDGKLTGAVFRVLAGEDILDRQGNVVYAQGDTVVDSIQTAGEDACAVTDELWPGLYEIVELTPPEGYAPSGEHFFVDARSAAQQSRTAIVTYEGLKTNQITMGAQAIVKVLGDREQDSDPKRVEKPEPGAEFEVYLRSAGSYENARELERDLLVTDENGYAMTKPLPYGIYVLRQTKGAEGYEIKGPIEFQIDGTESLTNPPVLTLSDKPILYRLRFIKVDRETGREITLSNASFRLKDADGNTVVQKVYYPKEQEIDTFVTDDTGSVTLPETVTWGAYTVEEVKAPEGYQIRDEAVSIFVGRDGDTADEVYALDFVIEDAPVKGRIVLEKVGQQLTGFEAVTDIFGNVCQRPAFEDRPLAGAVFEVRAAEGITGKDGTVWFRAGEVADTITTTGSGMDSSRELPLGRYVLVEVDAPNGYVFSEKEYEAILTAQDDQTPVVEAHVKALNAYMLCDITLKKEKEELKTVTDGSLVRQELVNTPGEGFVFGLYSAEDIRMGDVVLMADALVATGVTDAHGDLAFAGQFPHGEYLIRELAAPKGWKLSTKTYPVSLKSESAVANIIRAELPEAVHNELVYGTITLTKTDITGGETLPGALIEVRDEQGNVVYRAYTDEHGEISDIPVRPGRYTFRELLAPEGYALSEAVMTFEVDECGQVMGDRVIRDDYTRVCIRKQDENGEPLKGVEFGLFAGNGAQVQTALTDESGLAVFERIPYGEYEIRETKPLPGYVKNEHAQRVILDGHFVNPVEPVATFVNRHMQVRCIKVDTSGQRLAGVEFVLINADTDEIVEVVTSDGDGVFTFRCLDYGDWIIRESRAPEGFSRMEDVALHVDEGWTEPEPITCVNIPNSYEFMKTDNRGEPLAGARFALEAEDGTFIRDDLISGEDGIVHVTGLKPGRYVIREVEPAEGFVLTEETLTVTLDENYVPPKKLRRLKNYPEDYSILQTGVDFLLTPLGWAGIDSMLAGIAVWALYRTRKRRKAREK